MATAMSDRPMELEGSLRSFPLADVLRFLAMGRMSGTLSLLSDTRTVQFFIRDGNLVGTASSQRLLKLGELLICRGHIQRKDLDDLLSAQTDGRSPDRRIGELLIDRNLIDPDLLNEILELQAREELWEIFSWSDGTFKFEHGQPSEGRKHIFRLGLEQLVEDGVRQADQWREMANNLGGLGVVFSVREDLAAIPEEKIPLDTWRVLSLINSRLNIEQLVLLSGLGRFETVRALDELQKLELIRQIDVPIRRIHPIAEVASEPAGVASPQHSDQSIASNPQGPNGLRGLFGIRRRPADEQIPSPAPEAPTPKPRRHTYLTDVGLGCALVNQLIHEIARHKEIAQNCAGPAELLDSLWEHEMVRYPRADLIARTNGLLDAAPFERYVNQCGGITKHLQGIHEESIDALAALGERLVRLARERIGDGARGLIEKTARPYFTAEVTYPTDFDPHLWVQRWMQF